MFACSIKAFKKEETTCFSGLDFDVNEYYSKHFKMSILFPFLKSLVNLIVILVVIISKHGYKFDVQQVTSAIPAFYSLI